MHETHICRHRYEMAFHMTHVDGSSCAEVLPVVSQRSKCGCYIVTDYRVYANARYCSRTKSEEPCIPRSECACCDIPLCVEYAVQNRQEREKSRTLVEMQIGLCRKSLQASYEHPKASIHAIFKYARCRLNVRRNCTSLLFEMTVRRN